MIYSNSLLTSMIVLWIISVSSLAIAIVALTTDSSSKIVTPSPSVQEENEKTLGSVRDRLILMQRQFQKDEWDGGGGNVGQDMNTIMLFITVNSDEIVAECKASGWQDLPGRPAWRIKSGGFLPNPFVLLFGATGFDTSRGTINTSVQNFLKQPNKPSAMQFNEDLTSLITDTTTGPPPPQTL